jgi:hypothetical protein
MKHKLSEMVRNVLNGLKQKLTGFLESLAEENRKQFGNKRLSCCTLHQQTPISNRKESQGDHN